jgi:drug/metabolite transporter (DMT)-like permease
VPLRDVRRPAAWAACAGLAGAGTLVLVLAGQMLLMSTTPVETGPDLPASAADAISASVRRDGLLLALVSLVLVVGGGLAARRLQPDGPVRAWWGLAAVVVGVLGCVVVPWLVLGLSS